ncbi:hypothetical protein PIB30_006967 [Stylosanthes scabra]|uniref:Uncharacterized protein n=1 Tax=Stylosanthes scabra TaxID=79078 RepID=A0ABU6Y2T5_9FABA|nr:hypothetical protein [Stylosanthes scabra]
MKERPKGKKQGKKKREERRDGAGRARCRRRRREESEGRSERDRKGETEHDTGREELRRRRSNEKSSSSYRIPTPSSPPSCHRRSCTQGRRRDGVVMTTVCGAVSIAGSTPSAHHPLFNRSFFHLPPPPPLPSPPLPFSTTSSTQPTRTSPLSWLCSITFSYCF